MAKAIADAVAETECVEEVRKIYGEILIAFGQSLIHAKAQHNSADPSEIENLLVEAIEDMIERAENSTDALHYCYIFASTFSKQKPAEIQSRPDEMLACLCIMNIVSEMAIADLQNLEKDIQRKQKVHNSKSAKFIRDMQQQLDDHKAACAAHNEVQNQLKKAKSEVAELKNKQPDTCLVCATRTINTVITPCRHQVYCLQCVERNPLIRNNPWCPMCRRRITDIFGPLIMAGFPDDDDDDDMIYDYVVFVILIGKIILHVKLFHEYKITKPNRFRTFRMFRTFKIFSIC